MNIKIHLWDRVLGYAYWDSDRGICVFEYEPEFVDSGLDVSPLMMPLEKGRVFEFPALSKSTFLGLPPMLTDSLPDDFGNHIMNAWLAQEGLNLDRILPVERLSYVGQRGMGALEYEPERLEKGLQDSQVNINDLVLIANQVLQSKNELEFSRLDRQNLTQIVRIGTSAGGARAKAILAFDEKNKVYKPGDIIHKGDHSYWLLKMDGVSNRMLGDPEGYGMIEYAYYLMAKDCQIEMMHSDLLHENNRAHFITRRFDRVGNKKLHTQSLGGLAAMDYRQSRVYSYEQVFAVLRRMHMGHRNMEQQFRRMVFNVIARNQDDHVKNISCIMDPEGKWKLSPAYDLSYSYNPEGIWTRSHQLSVNGKRDQIDKEDLLKIGQENHIRGRKAIVEQISDTVSRWNKYAQAAGIDGPTTQKIRNSLLLF